MMETYIILMTMGQKIFARLWRNAQKTVFMLANLSLIVLILSKMMSPHNFATKQPG